MMNKTLAITTLTLALLATASPAQAQAPVESTVWLHDLGEDDAYSGCHVANENFGTYRLTVQQGSQVTLTVRSFENNTNIHTLSVEGTGAQTQPIQPGGSETLQFTVDEAGSVSVLCDGQSSSLSGLIVVREASAEEAGGNGTPGAPMPLVLLVASLGALVLRRARSG